MTCRTSSAAIPRTYEPSMVASWNFELPISGQSSALLIGKNGAGKTTVGLALEILHRIARGTNRVGDLVKPKDLARGRSDVPMRFEIEIDLGAKTYGYGIAFEFPEGFKELRVLEEKGHVRHEEHGLRYVYFPAVPRDVARRSALRSVAR